MYLIYILATKVGDFLAQWQVMLCTSHPAGSLSTAQWTGYPVSRKDIYVFMNEWTAASQSTGCLCMLRNVGEKSEIST
jgi:hypothetical protein